MQTPLSDPQRRHGGFRPLPTIPASCPDGGGECDLTLRPISKRLDRFFRKNCPAAVVSIDHDSDKSADLNDFQRQNAIDVEPSQRDTFFAAYSAEPLVHDK
jgi:hypothetical protein